MTMTSDASGQERKCDGTPHRGAEADSKVLADVPPHANTFCLVGLMLAGDSGEEELAHVP